MCLIHLLLYVDFNRSGGSVVRMFAPWAGGRGFDTRPRFTKNVTKTVPDASLLSALYIWIVLAFLSSQTLLKIKMDFIRNERSRVIIISWDNLFRNRPSKNKFKSTPICTKHIQTNSFELAYVLNPHGNLLFTSKFLIKRCRIYAYSPFIDHLSINLCHIILIII